MTGTSHRALARVGHRLLDIRSVPASVVVLVALASYLGLIVTALLDWPLWALVLAALLPWGALFTSELVWTYRHFHWLALFYLLVLTQGGHLLEHVVQMAQIHLLDVPIDHAHGIFSQLDLELVHFTWNTLVLLAVVVLLVPYRANRWLWVTLAAAVWHEIEHIPMTWHYLTTGVEGHPGLLAAGGLIAGGLPISRPNLHFVYNLVVTLPLLVAFGHALSTTPNRWLARALPHLSSEQLARVTAHSRIRRVGDGETLVAAGESDHAVHVIARGQVRVTYRDPANGEERPLAILGPGRLIAVTVDPSTRRSSVTIRARGIVEATRVDRRALPGLADGAAAAGADGVRDIAGTRPGCAPPSASR